MADTNMVSLDDVLHVEIEQGLLLKVVVEGSVLRLVFKMAVKLPHATSG
jgi:hypothetical protein